MLFRTHIASVLTLPIVYAGFAEPTLLPSRRHALPYAITLELSGDTHTRTISYATDEQSLALSQLATLHRVAAALITDSTDLEPEIVAAVNEEFWALLV